MIYLRVAHAKDTARSFTNMSLSLLKASAWMMHSIPSRESMSA